MRYTIITGTGRSGTNWLLDILDVSPETHCRNEPHGIPGSRLNEFPYVWTSDLAGSCDYYRAHWDDVAVTAARRLGVSDHHFRYTKSYLHPWSNHAGMSRLLTGPRARRMASRVDHRLRDPEWELPGWAGSRRKLLHSTGVLKILLDAPLLSWILTERPDVPVVHIIRHPGGRLNSWLTRLVGPMNESEKAGLRASRSRRLDMIRNHDPDWHDLIPDPSTLTLTSIELWFWRYVNESMIRAGHGHETYRLLRFDDLATEPIAQAELVYRHMGVAWGGEVAHRIATDTSRSVFGSVTDSRGKTDAWRTELSPTHQEEINAVMAGSPLAALLVTRDAPAGAAAEPPTGLEPTP